MEHGHQIKFELSPKWLRVMFGGQFIANSKRVYLLFPGRPPFYYFPKQDVRMDLLELIYHTEQSPILGDTTYWTIKVGGKIAQNAVWSYPKPLSNGLDLSGYVSFVWEKMDAWFEETEEVLFHPRNPYHRIDMLESTRHILVIVSGEKVAESH